MDEKPLHWIGSAKEDLLSFPEDVVDHIGYALGIIQLGGHALSAKVWKGIGPRIFEIVEDGEGGTYRLAYTVRISACNLRSRRISKEIAVRHTNCAQRCRSN